MNLDDTIAAISTPLGHGGIGIVRLSGKRAIEIAESVFLSSQKKTIVQTSTHTILHGHIVTSNREKVDEVLVSVMRAPHSYTREDVVEINCHGGPVPLRRTLELVLKNGARPSEPGEFTRRAFLNGRIDLAQAEAVLDVIHALTEQAQKAAIEQLGGGLSEKIESIRRKIIDIAAFMEACIDFPEEEIPSPSLKEIRHLSQEVRRSLQELIRASRYGKILREGLRTAIIGRPNVGKSSLLNALLEQERAIVAEIPGTTRDVIEDYLNIRGLPVRIMDTAGIREVEDIAEREGVRRSLKAMQKADLVLVVLDGSEELQDTDRELIERSDVSNTILVINKSDLPPSRHDLPRTDGQGNCAGNVEKLFSGHIVKVSALKGTGLDELKTRVVETALHGKPSYGMTIVTNARHAHALTRASASLHSFARGIDKKVPPEFLSVDLRESLDALGEITGSTAPEDILDRIFSNFCIGK